MGELSDLIEDVLRGEIMRIYKKLCNTTVMGLSDVKLPRLVEVVDFVEYSANPLV